MHRGGAETRTVELMPLLAEKGVHVDFCTLRDEQGDLDEKIRGFGGNIIPCPLRPGLLTFQKRFVDFLKRSDYDIVHAHIHLAGGYIARLAHRAGVKGRIVHFRSTSDGKPSNAWRKLYSGTMRWMVRRHATGILAVCRAAMEFGWGKNWTDDSRAKVVYNGIDLSEYDKPVDKRDITRETGIPEDSKVFIYVARIQPLKGHEILLEAMAKLPGEAHLLIVGDGDLYATLKSYARELSLEKNVHFLGSRSDVPRLLKAADCFVLPSLREGLPGVVLEALAADLPVVATDLPGVREIAEHTELIDIVPTGDSGALAKAMFSKVNNVNTGSQRKHSFPQVFDLKRCAETIFTVYASQVNTNAT